MKTTSLILGSLMTLAVSVHADGVDESAGMVEQARWARETPDLNTRISRLEKFLNGYLPDENGITAITEYEDGASALAVTASAWYLVRAYVEAGRKNDALKLIDWLQEHDSKSMLYQKKTTENQAPPSGTSKPSN